MTGRSVRGRSHGASLLVGHGGGGHARRAGYFGAAAICGAEMFVVAK